MEDAKQLTETYNLLHEYTPQIIAEVKKQLDPFIGKPIFKTDGSYRKAVNFQSPKIEATINGNHVNIHCWLKPEYGYVRLYIKICYNGGAYENKTYFCIYRDTCLDLYTMDKNDRIGLFYPDLSRYDVRYNLTEMQRQANKVIAMAKELETETSKIPWQFRDVLNITRLR